LIALHGFFVAGEFGLVAVDRSRIEQMAEEDESVRARSVLAALKTLSFQLSGAQLGITVTSLLVGFLIEPVLAPLFESFLSRGIAVAVGLILATSFEMVSAELVPKNLAIAKPVPVALALAAPMRFANTLMKPLIVFFNNSANRTVRILGIEPRDELEMIPSLEELQILIRTSREGGAIEEEEFSLLSRSITFGDKAAHDVLTPRTSCVMLRADDTIVELMRVASESGHSRFPVQGIDVDDIVGIAHVKDAYLIPRTDRAAAPISAIMRDALSVPESRDLVSLLAQMRRERQQMAVVFDEYGGTVGILTLEDVLEELVGEIEDEHDPDEGGVIAQPPSGIRVVPGLMHAHELKESTGFEMPEGDYETLGGFLLSLFDRIPEQGEHIAHERWEFKVVEMDRNRIAKVLVVGPPSREGDER
jgi:CBS domain containing-hemolysin-like protein